MIVTQTLIACPSQWDITLDDDRQVYARYRWGWLTFAWKGNEGYPWFRVQLGEQFDGDLDTAEMLPHLTKALAALDPMPKPPGNRRGHEPGCESWVGYHCTCQ